MKLNRDEFSQTLEKLLFNKSLELDFTTAMSTTPISVDMNDYEMLQSSIGQGKVQMTPIHLNMITSAIANDGVLMRPYLVDRIETATGVDLIIDDTPGISINELRSKCRKFKLL